MSRIHDALKRAEQERSGSQVIGVEVEKPVEPSAAGPVPVMPTMEFGLGQGGAATPLFPSPITFDAMLKRCSQSVWTPDKGTMLFFDEQEPACGSEEFRTLRARLFELREKLPLRKILVASSLPREGRSYIAANLAQVIALQPGCRALLIDADLRNSALHAVLGTFSTPGLSEYLVGKADEFSIIQRGQMENLFLIPSGAPVSGQSELVSNGRLKSLLDRVEPLFDWIIVDSPAAIPVSDAGLIANLCDGVLMVVRCKSTSFDIVRKARQRFRDDRVVGVVLNGTQGEPHLQVRHYSHASERIAAPTEIRG